MFFCVQAENDWRGEGARQSFWGLGEAGDDLPAPGPRLLRRAPHTHAGLPAPGRAQRRHALEEAARGSHDGETRHEENR